jgi:lysophospholipase L1-like esterase
MPVQTRDRLAYLVQFIHPAKRLAGLPGTLGDVAVAGLFGTDLTTYRELQVEFAANARRAAHELLDDRAFTEHVDRLPFTDGEKIIAVGDSLTDDLQSWFEILHHVLNLRRPGHGVNFVNAGISAETTTEVVKRFLDVTREKPDWVLCLLGANDTWYWNNMPENLSVSPSETERNLVSLRRCAAQLTTARWIWMTPPFMIPELVLAHWYQGTFDMMTANKDLRVVGDIIRRQPDPVIDLQSLFGSPVLPDLLLDDGLHPSLAGHQSIVRALVERLAS